MRSDRRILSLAFVCSLAFPAGAFADEQAIPFGVPKEGELSVTTGPDGVCNSTASGDDTQLATVGSGPSNLFEIGCGADGLVGSTAAGDDVQLRPVGSSCASAGVPVIDTGADGVANSAPGGDDTYLAGMVFGAAPAGSACVGTGADGLSGTTAAGDDVQNIAVGVGAANQAVVLCGDDLIPSTAANNANTLTGDDVQVIPVSPIPTCASPNDIVVTSGPVNSISDTLAEGAELVLKVAKPVKIIIASGRKTGAKSLKLQLYDEEFDGAGRVFRVNADDGNCPDGTLTLVDADYLTDGLQATGTVDAGGSARITMLATFYADRVRAGDSKIPFRCEADITVLATDTDPEEDDARLRRNNSTKIDFEVFDYNDRP
jgi:hypothetical protein